MRAGFLLQTAIKYLHFSETQSVFLFQHFQWDCVYNYVTQCDTLGLMREYFPILNWYCAFIKILTHCRRLSPAFRNHQMETNFAVSEDAFEDPKQLQNINKLLLMCHHSSAV